MASERLGIWNPGCARSKSELKHPKAVTLILQIPAGIAYRSQNITQTFEVFEATE